MSSTIGVMGCGWLGLPLANSLVHNGYKVYGSTTSREKFAHLRQQDIVPFQIGLSEDKIEGAISEFLRHLDVLVINIPPRLRGKTKENYVQKMQLLHVEVKKTAVRKVIFVSSTSVYGDVEGEVTEDTAPQPITESGKQLLASENIFVNDRDLQTTIIRFGGLIGPNRHPVTMLSGRQNLSNGKAPINLIHLNDCIRIISSVIRNSWWGEVMNGVYPEHPNKQKYYSLEAKKRGLQMPDYKVDNSNKGKKVHSKVLLNVKKFDFTTTL